MTTNSQDKPARAKKAPPTDCPHWGKGGSYLRDPATGLRTPAGQDGQAAEKSAPVKLPASASQPVAAKSTNTDKGI
jgi:hypothetical protein